MISRQANPRNRGQTPAGSGWARKIEEARIGNDGIAYRPGAQSSGMGLRIMSYRARTIGALLAVCPRAQGGARVTCTLPKTCKPQELP